jgi:chromosome segregation ATPase
MTRQTDLIMTRIDIVNDKVTDMREDLRRHESRLVRLEDMNSDHEAATERISSLVEMVSKDIKEIKEGPVYSLDKFITKRVAQIVSAWTGGVGVFLFFVFKFFGVI